MILVQLPPKGIHPQTIHYSMVGFEHVETNFVVESSESSAPKCANWSCVLLVSYVRQVYCKTKMVLTLDTNKG